MLAQLVLLHSNILLDVLLELLAPQLDIAGQGIQLLSAEAWNLGQSRVGVEKHGLGLGEQVCQSSDRRDRGRFGASAGHDLGPRVVI